jgi:hypothetical protein
MIRRSTWIILLVFLVWLGGAWYFQKYQAEKAAAVTPTVARKLLFEGVDQEQISGIEITSALGQTFAVAKDQDGNWVIEGFTAADTNTYQIEDMLSQLSNLTILSELDPSLALESVGLKVPIYTLKLTLQDGQQRIVQLGNVTPTGSGYYAKKENSTVAVVTKYVVDNLINYLDNPPLATPVPTAVETIEVEGSPTPQP